MVIKGREGCGQGTLILDARSTCSPCCCPYIMHQLSMNCSRFNQASLVTFLFQKASLIGWNWWIFVIDRSQPTIFWKNSSLVWESLDLSVKVTVGLKILLKLEDESRQDWCTCNFLCCQAMTLPPSSSLSWTVHESFDFTNSHVHVLTSELRDWVLCNFSCYGELATICDSVVLRHGGIYFGYKLAFMALPLPLP